MRDVFLERSITFFDEIRKNEFIKSCIENRDTTPEIRGESVLTSGTGIIVAARIGGYLFNNFTDNSLRNEFIRLVEFDWSRNNSVFEGKLLLEGKILNSRKAIESTTEAILEIIGLKSNSF